MSVSDAEVEAAAKAAELARTCGATPRGIALSALEAAAAVREQARRDQIAHALADASPDQIAEWQAQAVDPESVAAFVDAATRLEESETAVPSVPLSAVQEVREELVRVARLYEPKFRFAVNDAIDAFDAAFPQLKEQSE